VWVGCFPGGGGGPATLPLCPPQINPTLTDLAFILCLCGIFQCADILKLVRGTQQGAVYSHVALHPNKNMTGKNKGKVEVVLVLN